MTDLHNVAGLPYRIAVLCYLYDPDDRVLLLHRNKNPNRGMYSPIGGKLEISTGEGPHECAAREIREEAGLAVEPHDLHLAGIVSERAYEQDTHWLIFVFELPRAVQHEEVVDMTFDEGSLEWVEPERVLDLSIPQTDREVMWPLVREHRGGFFAVHIDCSGAALRWSVNESHRAGPRAAP